MRNNWLVIAAIAGLVIGCKGVRGVRLDPTQPLVLTAAEASRQRSVALKLTEEQPRTLTRMTQAAQVLEAVARALPGDYDAHWQAASALSFGAENDPQQTNRVQFAKRGIVMARQGRELQPDRVEAHYWYALNVGFLADADRAYGLNAVGEMEAALKRAGSLDEKYDYAGPLRVLGILHLRTPAPPVSIGSARKGLRLLERANELFPDYPENQLYLAEALRDNQRPAEARKLIRRVLAAAPWPDRQFESAGWKTAASQLLTTLPKP
ncbi:MAG: hypothetical protein PCFJNLEI_02746 [Verrucomicrobiae bacterium]|nr:hypothetical protein [Verrucomicrobiae bacterium]